jgi:hypothetical protein
MSKRVRTATVLAVLFLSLAAVAQTPLIGPETPVWNDYRSSLRPGYKYTASAAGSADGFLVTWCESPDQLRVLGARLTRDGKLAGAPFGIGFPPAVTVQTQADNDRYIVSSVGESKSKTWQVAPSGIAEIAPLPATPPVENANGEHIGWSWENRDFTITFYDQQGLQHGPPVRTQIVPSDAKVLYVQPSGDEWVVVTSDFPHGPVQWLRFNHTGVSASNLVVARPLSSSDQRSISPAVVHGSTLAFAWEEIHQTSTAPGLLEYQRSLIYTTLDLTTGFGSDRYADATHLAIPSWVQGRPITCTPQAVFDGHDFVYAWSWYDVDGNAEVRVVNGYGAPRTLARYHDVFPFDLRPVLAAGTEHNLVLWHTKSVDSSAQITRWDVLARAFDASSSIDDGVAPTIVSQGVTTQRGQSRALGPKGTFVIWSESSESETSVRGRFVPNDAAAGAAFVVQDIQSSTRVSANASTFLVAMLEYGSLSEGRTRVFVRRYDANGSPVDTQPVLIGFADPYNSGLNVVSESDSFVIAWTDRTSRNFVALRIPSRGTITAAPKKILELQPSGVVRPSLRRVHGNLVVVWLNTLDSVGDLLKATRISKDLEIGSTTNLWLLVRKYWYNSISLTFEGNDQELLVAASGVFAGESDTQNCVRVRRYGPDLDSREDPMIVECSQNSTFSPAVTWDGERWWVWDLDLGRPARPIRLWPLGGDGKPQTPIQITDGSRNLSDVALWPASYGLTLSYERSDDSAAGIMRTFQMPIFLEQPKPRAVRH